MKMVKEKVNRSLFDITNKNDKNSSLEITNEKGSSSIELTNDYGKCEHYPMRSYYSLHNIDLIRTWDSDDENCENNNSKYCFIYMFASTVSSKLAGRNLFTVNNKDTRTKINIIQRSLLLTLNSFSKLKVNVICDVVLIYLLHHCLILILTRKFCVKDV